MTRIRIPVTIAAIAPERMAALVTHALVAPIADDSKTTTLPGTDWLRWWESRPARQSSSRGSLV